MKKNKNEYQKPLSFSTTIRNPWRIPEFIDCLIEYEGMKLDSNIIREITYNMFQKKIIFTIYQKNNPSLWNKYQNELSYTPKELEDIYYNSADGKLLKAEKLGIKFTGKLPHKEAGFDHGWASRFDTRFKLIMELGFVTYEMDKEIVISKSGRLLHEAWKKNDNERIQNLFLNAFVNYTSDNPYKKTTQKINPLVFFLKLIKELESNGYNNGISKIELPLLICWKNSDYKSLAKKIIEIRKKYAYTVSEEIIYEICIDLLRSRDKTTDQLKNEFKFRKITKEAVDDFIRKMRITGIISLRGNGRFLDINKEENEKVEYILETYDYCKYSNKKEYIDAITSIDNKLIINSNSANKDLATIRQRKLKEISNEMTFKKISNELLKLANGTETQDILLKYINRPTRLEFLTAVYLQKKFTDCIITPNYSVDDEGIPKFTASGGKADIECIDKNHNSLFEVTLLCDKQGQTVNEIVPIRRHLLSTLEMNEQSFSVFIAPRIHPDTIEMVEWYKHKDNINILPFTINNFINEFNPINNLTELANKYIN